jgi:hypothetical protein
MIEVGSSLVGVVHQHRRPRRKTRPLPVARLVLARDEVKGRLVELREHLAAVHERHRGAVLGQEHVSRRGVPLLDELVRELEIRAVAKLDVDPGLLGEGLRDDVDELLVLSVVHDQGGPIVGTARAEHRHSKGRRGHGKEPRLPSTHRLSHPNRLALS